MRILTKSGYIENVALFFELNDKQLERISKDSQYYMDTDFLKGCYLAKGDNAHFYALCNNETVIINKHLKSLLKEYKTVSWWNIDMTKFMLKRRNICHKQSH